MSSMEDLFIKKQHPRMISTSTSSPPLAMHTNSQTISKVKPKIRIIHIFAPEIIKTDVANFRELVQRLTGKPADHHKSCKKGKNKKNQRIPRRENYQPRSNSSSSDKPSMMTMEIRSNGFGGLGERVKEEEETMMWNGASSGGFADLDEFIQELGEFPLLPMAMDANHNMPGIEEAQIA